MTPHIQPYWALACADVAEIAAGLPCPEIVDEEQA